MVIYKTTIKLKNEFKTTKYTKTRPIRKVEVMRYWYIYCDGFELSEEDFETFKALVSFKTKRIEVQP